MLLYNRKSDHIHKVSNNVIVLPGGWYDIEDLDQHQLFSALFISGYQIRWSGIEHTYSIVFHGLVIMAYLAIYSRIQVNNESKRVRLIMSTTNSAAKLMNADDRKELALKALKKDKSVSKLAEQNDVSRKFVHKQKNKLVNAIDSAFSETDATNDAHKVLYYMPVTKQYISLMVVCLLLFSRCSFRGIRRFLSVCLDYEISQGGIHNIAAVAIQRAEKINSQEDLSQAKLVANDEKFHLNKPILSGTDIRSLYCYLLRLEDTRDGDTWARNLLELKKKHFLPEAVYGDDGSGLYAGHKLVMPDVPYHRDHFHIIHELLEVRRYFRNRKKSSITYLNQRENKYYKAITKGNEALHEEQLFMAVKEAGQAGRLSSSIDTLVDWLCHDVLVKAGPAPEQRSELYDFIVNELKTLELIHPHRIKSMLVRHPFCKFH